MSRLPWLSPLWLAVRSLFWTALIPGVVAGFVPWRFFGVARVQLSLLNPLHLLALLFIGVGVGFLAACIWEFAHRGRGTLAPVDAPRQLVTQGPYRYVRNPMYLSVTAILLGEVLLTTSVALLTYWAVWFVAVNLIVIGLEEPTLRQQFGDSYEHYTRAVGRWVPRRR
ncbi:MAG TPA: isoprenylcysteine carboxylmethyltransferase family protein [Gemmatimonadales bacterium]|nr:isoprenylcysteine carboxylmethyltransferase family protein [Gemmatimonadales bacterium]